MNRSNKRYITIKVCEFKFCKQDIINELEIEYHNITSNLHELINKWEDKKEQIIFMKDLKYNHKRKINKDV